MGKKSNGKFVLVIEASQALCNLSEQDIPNKFIGSQEECRKAQKFISRLFKEQEYNIYQLKAVE